MLLLQDVKDALNIQDNRKDAQIETLIPMVYEHIKGYCNITEVPVEYDINALRMIEYHLNSKAGLTSESLSRHSVGYANEYPADVTKGLRRRLRW